MAIVKVNTKTHPLKPVRFAYKYLERPAAMIMSVRAAEISEVVIIG